MSKEMTEPSGRDEFPRGGFHTLALNGHDYGRRVRSHQVHVYRQNGPAYTGYQKQLDCKTGGMLWAGMWERLCDGVFGGPGGYETGVQDGDRGGG
ncbi:hypothetical protein CDD82_4399 [Ophiocordyceps australis]|uniref:Uncharacterized protein n=1 Tax=Ophiocordyceps australis TaxID=1399860 RepID=A0A2C5Z816_9HYPO|nr:hypothetical protein CDD82_4399 [Ophiocordyceps australis]